MVSPCVDAGLVFALSVRPLVIVAQAVGVTGVRKHLDDVAVTDRAALALVDHALELVLERLEPSNPALHLGQVAACDGVHGRAGPARVVGQVEQLTDRRQWEPPARGCS